jgi:hypothetical protein
MHGRTYVQHDHALQPTVPTAHDALHTSSSLAFIFLILATTRTCEIGHETVDRWLRQVHVPPAVRMELFGQLSVPLLQTILPWEQCFVVQCGAVQCVRVWSMEHAGSAARVRVHVVCSAQHYITSHDITVHHMTLQYITWHYSTSHDITVHHLTLHYITVHYGTSHDITLHHSTLQYITWHYITSQYITVHHMTLHYITWHHVTVCIGVISRMAQYS